MSHRRKRNDVKSKARPATKSLGTKTPPIEPGFLKFRHEIENNNLIELISKLSGLQLLPANQNHLIGLLTALEIVSTSSESGEDPVRSDDLAKALNQTLLAKTFVGPLEDPTANLFTENVIFLGCNYTVFPGLYPGGPFILSSLLESIFQDRRSFGKDFIHAVGASTISLLAISNAIADRVGCGRYIDGNDEASKRIIVPSDDELERLGKAVSFTRSELVNLLDRKSVV